MRTKEAADRPKQSKKQVVKCAIYTRKSTDENLNSDFTTLDNQREYCASFVKTREPEGWRVHSEEYTDPGFSGGNLDRPGLKKLLSDAAKGKFQIVVCYKYDRLTRNTKDFLQILDLFDRHGIHFVSVTQPIDTTSSVGRLMRSILMEFAQFEREMISERTRDKIGAMAKKGKRIGGALPLGYDVDKETKRLVVNEAEAKIVRFVFETYLKERSLTATARIANAQGYRFKEWTTRKGNKTGGGRFHKINLSYMLRNPLFIGKVRHNGKLYEGEHKGIVDPETFAGVREILRANNVSKKSTSQNKHTFLLKGLVHCAACKSYMTPHFCYSRKGDKYFYYRCTSVNQMDRSACDVAKAPARELENFVVERLGKMGRDPKLVREIVGEAKERTNFDLPAKRQDKSAVSAALGKVEIEARNLMSVLAQEGPEVSKKGFIMERIGELEARREELRAKLKGLDEEILHLETRKLDVEIIQQGLANFMEVFEKMEPNGRTDFIRLLVKEVVYDRRKQEVRICLFVPQGFDWGLAQFGMSCFAQSKEWLRATDTEHKKSNLIQSRQKPLVLWDKSRFMEVIEHRGRKRIVPYNGVSAIKKTVKVPSKPRVQVLLKRAYELKERLDKNPGMTRDALAREVHIDPSILTKILNLLNLAPEIQHHILAMPPSLTRGNITERRLAPVARMEDRREQLREFQRLLTLPERVQKRDRASAGPERAGSPFFTSNQSSI